MVDISIKQKLHSKLSLFKDACSVVNSCLCEIIDKEGLINEIFSL